jgi:hypothetical protein
MRGLLQRMKAAAATRLELSVFRQRLNLNEDERRDLNVRYAIAEDIPGHNSVVPFRVV